MKTTVYLESTIISYLCARPSRDLIVAAHQQLTMEWWEFIRPQVKCYISPFVLQEISAGDDNAAKKRTAITNSIPVLKVNPEIQQLSQRYFMSMDIPEKARLDAFHLAIAVWHEIDYLLSWNCKHIVSGRVKKVLDSVNAKLHPSLPFYAHQKN